MYNKILCWLFLAIFMWLSFFLAAQTPTDALLMAKGEFCTAVNYQHETWTTYWEGTLKRENGNIGTFSRTTVMPMFALGLSNSVTAIAALPWMETAASEGQVRGASGLQDWGLWVKAAVLEHQVDRHTLKVQAVAGITAPAANYLPDYAPFNLGLGCLEGSLRGITQYSYQNLYASLQMGYHFRGNATIERNYYYTNRGYYTDQVAIPNALTYRVGLGTWALHQSLRAEIAYDGLITLGGHDIRRQDVGFPSNKMIFKRIGANLQYQLPLYPALGFTVGSSYILAGRNVGQSSFYTAGLVYRFKLFGKQQEPTSSLTQEQVKLPFCFGYFLLKALQFNLDLKGIIQQSENYFFVLLLIQIKKMNRIIYLMVLISLLFFFSACEKELPTQLEFEAYPFTSIDEKGGTWKTILLTSPTQVVVPAPEAISSDAYQAELRNLKTTVTVLTDAQKDAIRYWGNNGLVRWNEIARELAAKYNLTPAPNADGTYTLPDPANPGKYPNFPFAHPPYTARALAYWSAAQFDALVAACHYQFKYNRPAPAQVDKQLITRLPEQISPTYPSDGATIATVSEVILTAMFPLEQDFLAKKATEHRQAMLWAGINVESDILAGNALGKAIATIFLDRASKDGMKAAQTPKPISDSIRTAAQTRFGWFWENLEKPQRPVGITPFFGKVRPWCIPNLELVRPLPPPAPGSPAFEKDAAELREIAANLTIEQRKIANFWSDGLGSYTPPGHWNRIASELIVRYKLNPLRTARVFAYLNMAIMDAGISCWDAKYYYHYPRPSQAIPGFKTILGIPNFPSYTSGHSTFSSAAATVLSHLFPIEQSQLEQRALEASLSRIYAGIHYRFDTEAGLEQGKKVGSYVVEVAKADGAD